MGTRSVIVLKSESENSQVKLYKHYDGYISETLPMILKAVKQSGLNAIVNSISKQYGCESKEMIEFECSFNQDIHANGEHGGLEYYYEVNTDSKNIDVYHDSYVSESDMIKKGTYNSYKKELDSDSLTLLNKSEYSINGGSKMKLVQNAVLSKEVIHGSNNRVDHIERTAEYNPDFVINGIGNPDKVSSKYKGIDSKGVIEALERSGLQVRSISKPLAKKSGNLTFNEHIIRMALPSDILALQNGTVKEIPEIVVKKNNNNRGTDRVMLGIYRLVCLNGMILGSSFLDIRIRHDNQILKHYFSALQQARELLPKVTTLIENMKKIQLQASQVSLFKDHLINNVLIPKLSDSKTLSVSVLGHMNPQRYEDMNNDLWTVFNRFQEYFLKGGVKYIKTSLDANDEIKKNISTTKTIKGASSTVEINTQVFDATMKYFQLAA